MLQVTNLQVNYAESVIVNDVSITVPSGQVVCLMGRNGMGKTTLMKAIMGTLKPRAGYISFDGRDVTKQPSHLRARAGVGYVPQGRGIFPYLTVYENLLMGFEAAPDTRVNLERVEAMYALFPVIKEMRKRVAGTLSGGQQQQLAIARAHSQAQIIAVGRADRRHSTFHHARDRRRDLQLATTRRHGDSAGRAVFGFCVERSELLLRHANRRDSSEWAGERI